MSILKVNNASFEVRAKCLILLLCGIIFLVTGIIMLAYVRKTDR